MILTAALALVEADLASRQLLSIVLAPVRLSHILLWRLVEVVNRVSDHPPDLDGVQHGGVLVHRLFQLIASINCDFNLSLKLLLGMQATVPPLLGHDLLDGRIETGVDRIAIVVVLCFLLAAGRDLAFLLL